eukprot:618887-Pyramimonas_sp.AAC.1
MFRRLLRMLILLLSSTVVRLCMFSIILYTSTIEVDRPAGGGLQRPPERGTPPPGTPRTQSQP